MSRAISTSVNLLRNSLNSCKTSISNKGVSVPSTTKISGLPALIDKIQTEAKYSINLDLSNYTYDDPRYLRLSCASPSFEQVIKISEYKSRGNYKVEVPKGNYTLYIGNSNSTSSSSKWFEIDYFKVGPETKVEGKKVCIICIADDMNQIKSVQLNRNNNGPVLSDWPMTNSSYFHNRFCDVEDTTILMNPFTVHYQNQEGEWISLSSLNDNKYLTNNANLNGAMIILDIDTARQKYIIYRLFAGLTSIGA